jgi:hypothetical protein
MSDMPPRHRVRVRPDPSQAEDPQAHSDCDALDDTAETVGYGRPPREHRFQPGQSGNPRGRPKGSRNVATIIAEVLSRRIRTKIDGQPQRILPTEALVHVVLRKALAGDRHAWETVFRWIEDSEAAKTRRDAIISLDDKETAILERMRARFGSGDAP